MLLSTRHEPLKPLVSTLMNGHIQQSSVPPLHVSRSWLFPSQSGRNILWWPKCASLVSSWGQSHCDAHFLPPSDHGCKGSLGCQEVPGELLNVCYKQTQLFFVCVTLLLPSPEHRSPPLTSFCEKCTHTNRVV